MIIVYPNGEFDSVSEEIAESLVKESKARIPNESDAEAYLAWQETGW